MRRARATPATAALSEAGVDFGTHAYDHDPRASSYGVEAAEALRVEPALVFKTLVLDLDGELVVAIVPVDTHLALKAVARALGGKKAALAEPARVERATGYVLGGVSPIAQKNPHRTVLDASATELSAVYVSAGRRGLEIEVAPEDLVRVTGAITAPVTSAPVS